MFDNKWQKKEMPLVSLIGMGGGIASPAFLASIVLNILKPTVFSPADDTGVPDFDYTAESSAITNIGTITVPGTSVFSTNLYTGNSSTQTISNGIDLSGEGGLVWIKNRDVYANNVLYDTERGATHWLHTDSTNGEGNPGGTFITYNSDGFTVGNNATLNYSGYNLVSWTFRKSPGFFDIVTYTGDGAHPRQIDHNLGSAPGMMIVKCTSASTLPNGNAANWFVYHRDAHASAAYSGSQFASFLNLTNAVDPSAAYWGDTDPTSTDFTVGITNNQNNATYIAYIFADNPSNEIKCGNYTGTGSGGNRVELGFEPSFLLVKSSSSSDAYTDWYIMDTARGFTSGTSNSVLYANRPDQENPTFGGIIKSGTGFELNAGGSEYNGNGVTYIYMAIGDAVTPDTSETQLTLTDTTVSKISDGSLIGGTSIDQVLTVGETVQADTTISSTVSASVFSTTSYSYTSNPQTITNGIDLAGEGGLIWTKWRSGGVYSSESHCLIDTERSSGSSTDQYGTLTPYLKSDQTNGQTNAHYFNFNSDGYEILTPSSLINHDSGGQYVSWTFREAPGFFDIVKYTGDNTGFSNQTISHDLGEVPGMIIFKDMDSSTWWPVFHKDLSAPQVLMLNRSDAVMNNTSYKPSEPTSTTFEVGNHNYINETGNEYIAYLFADNPDNQIKCGSYVGNGTGGVLHTLGFKPHWLMIKKATGSGDWAIVDSTRGNLNELYPNTNGAESTGKILIDFNPNGFYVDSDIANNGGDWDASGETYIYVAIGNGEIDITTQSTASGTVSASSGNTITLSNASGTWSTGMKIQGTDSDTKDNPDPIKAEDVSLTSSTPTAERNVNTWGDAVWEIATDENFTQNVQTATTALSATGTQTGPSFTLEENTGYYTRTKYSAMGQESEWSDVTYFVTKSIPVYADDLFSTYLYEGNADTSGSQTINNGIDLSGEGGFVWIKRRTGGGHILYDTERGATQALYTTNDVESARPGGLTSFNNNGFTVGNYTDENAEGQNVVAWTFRKAPGFFDVVSWTGDGTSDRQISHSLGSSPGCIFVKKTSSGLPLRNWWVWHRSISSTPIILNQTAAAGNYSGIFGSVSSTSFGVGSDENTNASGSTYVAYVFAHDDQSFGQNGDEAIIKCGVTPSLGLNSTSSDIDLGFEPQFLLLKSVDQSERWLLLDNMRGLPGTSTWNASQLRADSAAAETSAFRSAEITSTGFRVTNFSGGTSRYIYMAIRRPHKPPTAGTEVFTATNPTSSGTYTVTAGFPVDSIWYGGRSNTDKWYVADRLRGSKLLRPNLTNSESTITTAFDSNTQFILPAVTGDYSDQISYCFKRAPGFMDVVTYDGTGSPQNISHNLGVVPEMIIVKRRDATGMNWGVYNAISGNTKYQGLNDANSDATSSTMWNNTTPTSSVFTVGSNIMSGQSGGNYVSYLFATLDGISKVGTYTGSGNSVDVDCGFTEGARFVMIKRLDGGDPNGNWFVFDTVRGITESSSPWLALNSNSEEQTGSGNNFIDPHSSGFSVDTSIFALNESGGTYLFLAIA